MFMSTQPNGDERNIFVLKEIVWYLHPTFTCQYIGVVRLEIQRYGVGYVTESREGPRDEN